MRTNKTEIIQAIKQAKRNDYFKLSQLFSLALEVLPSREIEDVKENIKTYFKENFGDEIVYYFKHVDPNHHFIVNISLWCFLAKDNFPTVRLQIGQKQEILDKQLKGLKNLGGAVDYYSTIQEFVEKTESAFYFDPDDTLLGRMKIYEVDVNNKNVLTPIIINGAHRNDLPPKGSFSFKNLEQYSDARNGFLKLEEKKLKLTEIEYKQEIAYQNQVIRWYIRTGLFNPLGTKIYSSEDKRNLENYTNNLLTEKENEDNINDEKRKRYIQILKDQFDSSREFNNTYSTEQDTQLDEVIDYIFSVFPKHIAARIYTFDTGFFDLSQEDNFISHIYWIPLLVGRKDRPTGGVQYLNIDNPIHIPDGKEERDLLLTMSVLTHLFSGQFDDSQMKEIDYINQKTTSNSAGVSVMSRNISHNIGSHAISYEKNALTNLASMLNNNVLEGLVSKDKEGDGSFYFNKDVIIQDGLRYKLNLKAKDFKLTYLEAVGFFLGYLQERIDYTSAVASGTRFYYGKVHLLEDVVLHFLRLKKFEIEKVKNTADSKRWNSTKRNILLERIVLSEDYHKKDIYVEYIEKDCKDVLISLPTGATGRQSIFAMLENIIRNTAKHGVSKSERGDHIKITVLVENHNDDFYKISLIDNSGVVASKNNKLDAIQKSIKNPLMIDGKINERQKGIKEIQIAAAWLRGIEPRDIDEIQESDEPVLSVDFCNTYSEVGGLKFELFVNKAKEVLLIGVNPIENLPDGWHFVLWSELKSIVKTTQYSFILFDNRIKTNDNLNLLQYAINENISLPVRHLLYDFSQIDFEKLGESEGKITEEAKIYSTWLNIMDKKAKKDDSQVDTNQLKIGIQDNSINEADKQVSCIAVTASQDETFKTKVEENSVQLDIIYRQHNDKSDYFEAFQVDYEELYDRAIFIEGISGNNSTSRILRDEVKTPYWCRKIQESAACKVMIIDERIWKETIFPREDGSGFDAEIEFEYDRKAKKHIYIYTIRSCSGTERTMELVNLKNEIEAIISADGTMQWTGTNTPCFHFVSFHQGLLDKIYNFFYVIKPAAKKAFFANMKQSADAALRYYFHSGRSFTPELPENTGFIPLSSIDVAMRDCKYRLTDLLFSGALVNKNNHV